MTTRDPNAKTLNPKYQKAYRAFHAKGGRTTEPILGVQRRLQALSAIGYSIPDLIEATGLSRCTIWALRSGSKGGKALVYIDKVRARQIKDAYRLLSVQPLHNEGANKARTWARKSGWNPPMAWNDIDDPDERPTGTRWITSCRFRVNRTRHHPDGRACGIKGQMRRGLCNKHYMYSKRKELL